MKISFSFQGWCIGADITVVTVAETGEELNVSGMAPEEVLTKLKGGTYYISLSNYLYKSTSYEIEMFDFEESDKDTIRPLQVPPVISWPLRRLLMAVIENDPNEHTVLETAYEDLVGGYEPYEAFPVPEVQKELWAFLGVYGKDFDCRQLLTAADWQARTACDMHGPGQPPLA